MKNIMKYPLIHHIQKEEIIKRIGDLSQSYTPEWDFNTESPDVGSVIALIYAHMYKESMEIVNKTMNKHHIAFLNCLDIGLKEAIPAESYVTFEVVPTADTGVFIPKGTKLLARGKEGGDIVFSTCHSVYATTHTCTDILFTSQIQDKIICAYEKDGEPLSVNMAFFDFNGRDIQSHTLSLAHPYILKGSKKGILKLKFETSQTDVLNTLADARSIEWKILTEEGFKAIKSYQEDEKILALEIPDIPKEPIDYRAHEAYWLLAEVKDHGKLPFMSIKGIQMLMAEKDLTPNVIYVQDIEQTGERFMPFGNPLELYAECYIKCDEAFSKHGADIELSFELSYMERENILPVPEETVHFKYIMRKPQGRAPVEKQEIRVDEVLWDYWNGTGWVRLFDKPQEASLFNGKRDGKISLSFKCPEDMDSITVNAYEGQWIRVRMLRGDNIYTMPSVEIIPVIENLKISYTYLANPVRPSKIFIDNNTYTTDITSSLYLGNETILFRKLGFDKPACFIGFEELPEQSPLSVFFHIKNGSGENTPSLTFQYGTFKNDEVFFDNLKVSDGTKNLKNSGNMIFILPENFKKVSLFSKERYWIKITDENSEYENRQTVLPHVEGIYFNTARVINQIQKSEKHYVADPKGTFKIKLQEKNIINIQVFVNEVPGNHEEIEQLLGNPIYNTRVTRDEQGEIDEFWIKWQEKDNRLSLELEERNYYIDKVSGEIIFPENIFITFPATTQGLAIEVIYDTCDGTRANVEKGMINGLQSPVPFISNVFNPIPAFGSSDFESIEKALMRASHLLENRDRAVSIKDYETIIKNYASSINRVRCLADRRITGEKEPGCMTIAILTDDYLKGSHTFLAYKDNLEKYLLKKSSLNTFNRKLYLKEPVFVELMAHVWLVTDDMEKAYEFQRILQEKITQFFDPLKGYFDGRGWEIGVMPKHNQLHAYLKSLRLECGIQKIIITAQVPTKAGKKEKDIEDIGEMPFAVPISGQHKIIVNLK